MSNGSERSFGSGISNVMCLSIAEVLLLLVCTTPAGMTAIEYLGSGYVAMP